MLNEAIMISEKKGNVLVNKQTKLTKPNKMNFEKTERQKTIQFDVDFSTEVKQMKSTTISSH